MATTNDGSTKAKAIVDKAETVTKDATKVTDLKIDRAGKVYTASWKNMATYSSIKIKYRLKKDGTWFPWTNYTNLGTSDTNKAFVTINYANYNPYLLTYLTAIEVGILVDQANEEETVYEQKKNKAGKKVWHKHTKTTKYTAKLTTAIYDLHDPKKPELSVTDGTSNTTFTLKVPESNTDGINVTTRITKWTKHIENWGTKDPSTNYDWSNEVKYESSTGKYSSDTRTFTHSFGAANVPQGKSYTVMAKAVAQGPNGDASTAYDSIVYAWPKVASNIKTSAVDSGSTQYKVTVAWDKNEDSTHPCKRYKIQYYIGTPATTSMGIPSSGVSWTDATDYITCQSKVAQTTTILTPRIGDEQCLWIRVIQNNVQNLETPSAAVLVKSFNTLVAPTIESVEYDAVSRQLTVSVDSNTNLDGVTTYVNVGSTTLTVPASGTVTATYTLSVGNWNISARNYFGSVYSGWHTVSFDPSRDADNPTPYIPTGLSASKVGTTGNVKLTWTPTMKGVTSSRITVADNDQEWSYASPDFIQDITVTGSATSAIINGLELGASYYFRVQSTNSHGTSDYSAIYGPVKLSAADVPSPNITLQETTDHGIRVSWNWNDWAAAKGIQIAWSTDRNDRDGSNPTQILKGLSSGSQSYIISPYNVERGETWYVWAWFTSGSARSNPDEEHILLPIQMSAPTNLSLVREALGTDEEGQTSVRLSWTNNTVAENTTSIELSWSDNPKAWETTNGASTYETNELVTNKLIQELTLGKTWYARVRTIYNEKHYVWSSIASIDLRTTPSVPRITVSKNLVSQYGSIDFSWSYSNEDLSEQASAVVQIYNSSNVLVGNVTVANSDKAVTVYCEQIGLVGDYDYHATVQTTSANRISSAVSEPIYFTVVNIPIASITSTSLVDEEIGDNPQTYTGEIVHIDNSEDITSVRSLNVSLDPIQDLHGYDKPWSGGNGVNKLQTTATSQTINGTTFTVNEDGSVRISGTPTATARLVLTTQTLGEGTWAFYGEGFVTGVRLYGAMTVGGTTTYPSFISAGYNGTRTLGEGDTISSILLEVDARFDGTAITVKCEVAKDTTPTSWTPYSNICPISGRTEVVTHRTGKNLLDIANRIYNTTNLWYGADTSNGTPNGSLVLKSGTYTFSTSEAVSGLYVADRSGNIATKYGSKFISFTLAEEKPIKLLAYKTGSTIDVIRAIDTQLELGSTATSYEPYDGDTYTTALGRTVYGGTLDVVSGELVVDRAIVGLGTLEWAYESTYAMFRADMPSDCVSNTTQGGEGICSAYERYTGVSNFWSAMASGQFVYARSGYSSAIRVYIKNANYTDPTAFKTAVNGQTLVYELATPQTYTLTPQQIDLLLGQNNVWSDGVLSIDTLDAPRQVKALKEMPLTVNVGGVPTNGRCIVYIERSKTIQIARPDESTAYGYEGELVAVAEGTDSVTIEQSMLHTAFTDGGEYRIYAIALNQLGTRSDPVTLDFTVEWTHQAIKPTATYVVDPDLYIAKITPIEPEGALETDTFDIYRLSADKPELIVQGGEWGTTYVDPYITLGDNAGYRVVMRTEYGDYTTAENEIAWLDLIPPNGTEEPFLDSDAAIIDFDGQQVEITYNLDVTHSWDKDFTETKYLGGSVQGDWNPAVSRKASMGGVMIKLIEADDIIKMKRLAAFTGICHVRTPDGSSFSANIAVTEAWSSDKEFGFAEYTLDITRVDNETLDGMTLTEWEETHGVE